jgi:signal transduction histidine kinase/DNA-binding response OmpR family regulator
MQPSGALSSEGRHLLSELRLVTTWRLLGISIGLAWLWMMRTLFGQPQKAGDALVIFTLLVLTAGVVRVVARRWPVLALPCLLVSLTLAITVAIALLGIPDLLYLYTLPVLIAGALTYPWAGFVAAGLIDLAFVLIFPVWNRLLGREVFWSGVALMINLTALVAWAFARNFYLMVDWMYQSYLLAERRTREAQLHRSQLLSTLKDLDLAYYRLRRANEALAWARQQAEEARQAKARFVANVSHELRTPLNLIIGFSELMVTAPESYGEPLPAAYRGDLNAIYRNAKHLSDLIDDVLDLSQIEADRMPLTKESGDLRQVIEEATRMVQGMVEAKGLTLKVDLPPMPVILSIDITRIRQVLLNLLSNAIRFTKKGGITVRLVLERDRAVVTVIDTGPGIPSEELSRVFEAFYQVDETLRREHGGTGLGLAISKHFVELHGGQIWAESQVGQGSTFGFSLPLSPSSEDGSRLAPSGRMAILGGEAKRILVVWHDDPSVAVMLQRHLEGYHVRLAVTAAEVFDAIVRLRPTAVIVDSEHSVAANELLQDPRCSEVPLISCPLPTRPRIAVGLHSADYLLKPVTREALRRALASYSFTKVLIVDDDPAMVRLLARVIHAEWPEVQVLQAYDGATALEVARSERPDLMLLDLLMPGMTGLEVLEHVRQKPELSAIRVIVITATEMGEQATWLEGEIKLALPQPLALTEWLRLLRALTTALRPVPEPDSASAIVPAVTHLG